MSSVVKDDSGSNKARDALLKDAVPQIQILPPSAEGERSKLEDTENSLIAASDGRAPNGVADEFPCLETIDERRMRRKSHYIIYVTTFVMSIGFSIVLTGVWPYLKQLDPLASKEFLGWVIAANPLGQMLASPLLGLWANHAGTNRGAFFTTITMFIVGNFLYAFLPLFKHNAKYIMVLSRFIVGISSANIALCRSYIASSTRVKERTTAISITAAAQSLGFILGPSIQSGLALAFGRPVQTHSVEYSLKDSDSSSVEESLIPFNMYTAVGWFGIILGFINFGLVTPFVFQEHFIAKKEATLREAQDAKDKVPFVVDYVCVISILVSFFITQCVYVLLETLLVPLALDQYAWDTDFAVTVVGIGLSCAGVLASVVFIINGILSKKFGERRFYMFGFVAIALALLMHFPVGSTYPKIKDCQFTHDGNVINIGVDSSPFLNSTNIATFPDNDTDISSTVSNDFNAVTVSNSTNSVNCSHLGCPSIQKWCYYTPIIEVPQIVVGQILIILGYSICFALSSAIFSKLLGPSPQGIWMGVLTSTGSLARIIGPVFVFYVYSEYGTRWTFGSLSGVVVLIIILNIVMYSRISDVKLSHGMKGKLEAHDT